MHRSSLSPLRTRRLPSIATPAVASTPAVAPVPFSRMKSQTRKTLSAVGAVCLAFAASSHALSSPADHAPPLAREQQANTSLVRGRYLVEHVGLCADCHTPRNEKGQFLREQWMKGAPLPFQPTVPMPWSPVAPPLAGLPTMTEEQAVAFMRTGKRPDGTAPRPPMPEFRFNEEDAKAVVAYLKSLAK